MSTGRDIPAKLEPLAKQVLVNIALAGMLSHADTVKVLANVDDVNAAWDEFLDINRTTLRRLK